MTDVKKDVENKVAVKEHDNRCESYEKYMKVCHKVRNDDGRCRNTAYRHGRKSKEYRYCMRGKLYETVCRWQCVKVMDVPGTNKDTKNGTDKGTNEK